MSKEIFFLKIGELANSEQFLGKVETLLQVPITEKTSIAQVYTRLQREVSGDEEAEIALHEYIRLCDRVKLSESFMKSQFFTPEPEIALFAIFHLKTKP